MCKKIEFILVCIKTESMYLSKEDRKEKKNRKNKKVKNPPTKRQLKKQNAKSELKAEKMAAKNALWEKSKVVQSSCHIRLFRRARGLTISKFAQEELHMLAWQWH
jgi:hypothetical protein